MTMPRNLIHSGQIAAALCVGAFATTDAWALAPADTSVAQTHVRTVDELQSAIDDDAKQIKDAQERKTANEATLKEAKIAEARRVIANADKAAKYLKSVGEAVLPSVDPTVTQKTETVTSKTNADGSKTTETTTSTKLSQQDLRDNTTGKQKFGGLEFGIGISFSENIGDTHRIKEAELVNGIVRIKERSNASARILLESHYLFTPQLSGNGIFGINNPEDDKRLGFGPFIAFQPGTNNVIDAIGIGFMVGLRRSANSSESFNIGLGVISDLSVKTLGAGIEADKPLPVGETAIRYLTRDKTGILIMTSYSF